MVITNAEDIVKAVPALLGFIPQRSVVILWLKETNLVVIERADDSADWLAWRLGKAPTTFEYTHTVILCYSEQDGEGEAARLKELCATYNTSVLLVVGEDSYWENGCVKELRVEGPDYETFKQAMRAHPDEKLAHAVKKESAKDRGNLRSWRIAALEGVLANLLRGEETNWAQAVVALEDIRVRDTFLYRLRGQDRSVQTLVKERLSATYLKAPWASGVGTGAAICHWQDGDGTRARLILEQVLEYNPGYSLAQLVRQGIAAGLNPAAWDDALGGLDEETCLSGPVR